MKLYQRLFIAASALTLGVFGGASSSQAQQSTPQPIWANYDVQYVNQFYNPLAGAFLISADAFRNFTGGIDHDDGVANNIPVGFNFDYNGVTYNSINVCVNGWVSVGNQQIPLHRTTTTTCSRQRTRTIRSLLFGATIITGPWSQVSTRHVFSI